MFRRFTAPAGLVFLLVLLTGLGSAHHARAQAPKGIKPPVTPRGPDGQPNPVRPTRSIGPDTARTAVSGNADSLRASVAPKGDVETTVKYQAKDSIRFEVQNKVARLYREASIDYGDISLKSALITVDYSRNLLTAEGAQDSTGKVRGKPVFKQGASVYTAGRINYNFKTRKGKISEAVTQEGEGYVHAEVVKKNERNEIFGLNGRYTTCNLEHPHFFINASKMKVIPREKVVTGPFNLVIGDIPTPLGFLFGYFPTPAKSRASGLIIPSFGQSTDRGFFLRNGGYYWAANDYIGVRLTGDVYAGAGRDWGGFNTTAEMQYIKRYTYTGRLSFRYSQRPAAKILQTNDANTSPVYIRPRSPRSFWIDWGHTPTPRPGGGRFSASVGAGSNSFNEQNSVDQRDYLSAVFNSTISYQKQIRNSPINYSFNLTQNQNTQTGAMDFTLPDVTVGVARQYPYELLGITPRGRFYEQFAIGYTLSGRNQISNQVGARQFENGIPLLGGTSTGTQIPVSLGNLAPLLRNSRSGVKHTFQITLGSYTVLKHLNLSPSIDYGESWYNKRLDYQYIAAARAVRIDTVRGFNRVYRGSANVSLATNFYGIVPIKGKVVEAVRHKVTPSVALSFSPDFTSNPNFYQNIDFLDLQSPNGQLYGQRTYSRFNGGSFGYDLPGGQQQSTLSFLIQNQVEMKVRNRNDTTGTTPFKKVSIIDGLDLNVLYDLAADSFRLKPLSVNFHTQVAQKLGVTFSSGFSFYQRDSTGREIDRYLWQQRSRRLARLMGATLSLNYAFNPSSRQKKSTIRREVAPLNDPALGAPRRTDPYEDYVDFEIPWELNSMFSANYSDPGPLPGTASRIRPSAYTSVSLTTTGSIKLTPNFRIGYNASYDFVNKQIVAPSLDLYRDLHCWQITGNWVPLGPRQGYFVTIAAKSSLLQDLKLNRNRSFLNR
ncbi:hypothetical protein LJY25_10850 [Hymenobacter sp. BT175]|uniref:putative LPS assembly protein LptD n=1 Tax=Hymenobacter translucens TaxID=2886507 RepID=UPI001D0EBA55|nr:putative LPS assembly protein LptD [Hymenobacter translucens]MCC2546944.1 hypothetical protein [Hymenobacter translucens]